MPKLKNHRRERFCKLYVGQCDFVAARAARGAGYAAASSNVTGSKLLTNTDIQARIVELMEVESDLFDMSAEEARAETAALASFNMLDFYDEEGILIPIHELPREVAACINEVEYDKLRPNVPIKVKAGKDKLAALDKIHRIHGSYEDAGKVGVGEIHIHMDEKDMKA